MVAMVVPTMGTMRYPELIIQMIFPSFAHCWVPNGFRYSEWLESERKPQRCAESKPLFLRQCSKVFSVDLELLMSHGNHDMFEVS